MTLGPLEYTVIGFEGNRFNGEIARELENVVDKGVIRLVDVVFITKNIDGEVAILEVDNKDDPRFASFAPLLAGLQGLFTEDDVVALGANPRVVSRLTGADPARVRAVARTASSPDDLPPAPELLQQIADLMGLPG